MGNLVKLNLMKVFLSSHYRVNDSRMVERFETRRDQHFDRVSITAKVDLTMRKLPARGSPNIVSILLCSV